MELDEPQLCSGANFLIAEEYLRVRLASSHNSLHLSDEGRSETAVARVRNECAA